MPAATPPADRLDPFSNTPPAGRTPDNAAEFSNTPAAGAGVAVRLTAIARAPANLASLTTTAGIIDGVSLLGAEATRQTRPVLLTAQTTPSQNGLYVPGTTGTVVTFTGAFSGAGQYIKTGLTPDRLYYWVKGTFEASVNNDEIGETLTTSGFIRADGQGTLIFTGTANENLDGALREANLVRADVFNESMELPADTVVQVTGGTGAPRWWRLAAAVPIIGTSPVTFQQITTS